MTRVFISYSHQDESYRIELEKHLSGLRRNGYIDTWTDRKIVAGEEWDQSISEALLQARIILLLISSDFLASDYCYEVELKTALERHELGEAVVIPIILRHCDWQHTSFSKLQVLPLGGKPIKDWDDMDEAYLNVVNGIKASIRRLKGEENDPDFEKPGNPAEELLSSLRRRALLANDARDFRILQFDVNQFKLEHPQSFEIEEIERIVKNGLAYETQTTAQTRGRAPATKSPPARIRLIAIIALIILALIIYFGWRYLR